MEASADVSMDSGHAAEVYNSCLSEGVYFGEALVSGEPCTYKLYQNVLQTLLRVRVALLLKATSENGESGFLTVCALVPGAQSSGPSSSLAGDPIVFKVTLSTQESKWYRRIVGELRGSD